MIIFKKELRANAVSFLVWSVIVGGLMAVCVALYPSMSDSMGEVSELFAGMGDFSAAFGLDKLRFGTILGFYGTECGNILGLGGAFYAAITAMGLLAGEEGGHTAEFLLTHPVSRLRVCLEKLAALLLMQVEIGGLCFGLSAFLRRGGLGLGMGLAALAYFAGLLINLDQGLDWLRYVTPYYYADAARVFAGEPIAGPIAAGCALGVLGTLLGLWWYQRKDIAG